MDAEPDSQPRARYAMAREGEIRHFLARADTARITQALFEAARELSTPLGLALVEADGSREWVVDGLRRETVLEGLLTIRDLLGRGGLDVAIFSSHAGFEIFLDRFGTLEFRTGVWGEPQIRTQLQAQGFEEVESLAAVPGNPPPVPDWDAGTRSRLADLTTRLGMAAPPPDEDGD